MALEYRGFYIRYNQFNHSYRLYPYGSKKHIFEGDSIKECQDEVDIIKGGDDK